MVDTLIDGEEDGRENDRGMDEMCVMGKWMERWCLHRGLRKDGQVDRGISRWECGEG